MCAAGPSTTPMGELPYSNCAGAAKAAVLNHCCGRRVGDVRIPDEIGPRAPPVAQRRARHADAERCARDEAVDAAQLPPAQDRIGHRMQVVQEALVAAERQLVDRVEPQHVTPVVRGAPAQVSGRHERLQAAGLVGRHRVGRVLGQRVGAGEREAARKPALQLDLQAVVLGVAAVLQHVDLAERRVGLGRLEVRVAAGRQPRCRDTARPGRAVACRRRRPSARS